MFEFLGSSAFIFGFIVVIVLLLFVLFVTGFFMGPRSDEPPETPVETARADASECSLIGFAHELPQGEPLPDECFRCPNLVKCMVAQDAFDWYTGRTPTQKPDKRVEASH